MKVAIIALALVIVGIGTGFGLYVWKTNGQQLYTDLDTSFRTFESTALPEGAKDIKLSSIETLDEIHSRQLQFTDKDGNTYLVTAIEVGSTWVNIKVDTLSLAPKTTPAPAPTSTP